MPLFRDGAFVEDQWIFAADEAPLSDAPTVVSKARFLRERPALLERNAPLGLVLQAGEDFDGIEADLPRFAVIALTLPKFTDGRAYSLAWLLRERHGFKGEIRARGEVLRDQLSFLLRSGFTTLEVTHEPTVKALSEGRVTNVSVAYQPDVQPTVFAARAAARGWLKQAG